MHACAVRARTCGAARRVGTIAAVLPHGFLAIPGPNDARPAALRRKLCLLALRDLLGRDGRGSSEPVRRALPRVQAALWQMARPRAALLLEAIGADDVLPLLLSAMSGAYDADAALRAAVPQLLAQLGSVRGALEEAVLWDVPVERLARPERGIAIRFDPPARGLLADPSGVEVRLANGARVALDDIDGATPQTTIVRAFHPVPGTGAQLGLVDANPLAMLEEHPEKRGNAVDLGGRTPEAWLEALAAAIDLVRIALPTLHAELAWTLRRIVPVGFEPERHLSASYREAPGLVYLTLHPSTLTLAEAIVHETQHGKLNVLSWFDPLLANGRTTWTTSPVRPDVRPLSGVLLAVHAFVPVAALHRRLADLGHPIAASPEFAARRAQVLAGNERGLAIVRELGEPTPLGRQVLEALEDLHAYARAAMPVDPAGASDEAFAPG